MNTGGKQKQEAPCVNVEQNVTVKPEKTDMSGMEKGMENVASAIEKLTLVMTDKPEKTYVGLVLARPIGSDCHTPYDTFLIYTNKEGGPPCVFPPNTDPNNPTNQIDNFFEEYEIMDFTKLAKRSFDSPIIISEIPSQHDGLNICGTGAAQDVLALIQADADAQIAELTSNGFPVPSGYHLGVAKIGLQLEDRKMPVHCDDTGTDIITTSNGPATVVAFGNETTLAHGGQLPFGKHLFDDGNCNGCAPASQEIQTGDITINSPVGSSWKVNYCFACFADDTNAKKEESTEVREVQNEGK